MKEELTVGCQYCGKIVQINPPHRCPSMFCVTCGLRKREEAIHCDACWEVESRLSSYLARGGGKAFTFVARALADAAAAVAPIDSRKDPKMISAYAKRTSVPVKKTKAELDDLLEKFGAASRGIMSDDAAGNAAVVFILEGQKFRLDVPLPARSAFRRGDENRQEKAWEQACRERWRAVLLLVRAKLGDRPARRVDRRARVPEQPRSPVRENRSRRARSAARGSAEWIAEAAAVRGWTMSALRPATITSRILERLLPVLQRPSTGPRQRLGRMDAVADRTGSGERRSQMRLM